MLCILILLFIRHNIKNEVHHRIILFQFGIAAYVETTNFLLDVLAKFLTNYENHRTQTEYETSLLCKGMMLKFVNSFFALYYVAFFKEHQTLFSEPMECLRRGLSCHHCKQPSEPQAMESRALTTAEKYAKISTFFVHAYRNNDTPLRKLLQPLEPRCSRSCFEIHSDLHIWDHVRILRDKTTS
ncbi:ano10 [Symbiodinium sp. CCMP2592]|nr:ano10 [Symbiodinium sp. CCMP2592]